MTRRGFFLTPLVPAASASDEDEFRIRAAKHELAWNPFIRSLFGCPDTGEISKEACPQSRWHIDRKLYAAARDTAKKFFDLRD